MAFFDGFPFNFAVHTGKEALSDSVQLDGERVVKCFIEQIDHPNEHCFYTDNFFASSNLLLTTKEKKIRHTGTVRQNQIGKCSVIYSKEFKIKVDEVFGTGGLVLVEWNDSKPVFVMLNLESIYAL